MLADHYAVLGVPRTATHEQIRRAYRERMRAVHPDSRAGTASTAEVTRIAEAWNVLSSSSRRAAYDLQLATGSAVGGTGGGARVEHAASRNGTSPSSTYDPLLDRVYQPARFPWRFVLITIGIGTAIVLILHVMGDPMPPRGIDGLITSGSCVDFDNVGAAYEVPCDGPHQATVRALVPFDAQCDSDTTRARDKQGMGTVCIEP